MTYSWQAKASIAGSSSTATAIDCPSTTACYASTGPVAGGVTVLTTTDGWAHSTSRTVPGASRLTFSCATVATCVAVGQTPSTGGLAVWTADGGATWTASALPPATGALTQVSCPTASTCLASGRSASGSGLILKSDDGGTTWAALSLLPGTPVVRSIDCPSTLVCYAGSDDDTVLITTDGGTTWKRPTNAGHPGTSIQAISCRTTVTCVVIGVDTTLFTRTLVFDRTGTGGTDWASNPITHATVRRGATLDLTCPGGTNCYLAGVTMQTVPTILVGTYGGSAWQPSELPFGGPAQGGAGVACHTPAKCVATTHLDLPTTPTTRIIDGPTATPTTTPTTTSAEGGVSAPTSGSSAASCTPSAVGSASFPGGYWLATAKGAVYSCGDAPFYGSLATLGIVPAAAVVGIASTPDHQGYWLVGADGGVYAFGDAAYWGSMGAAHLAAPVVGMAATAAGGYYEVAADGGVFAFGPGATFDGSMGGQDLAAPMVGMATAGSGSYYEVAADGGVFAFGPAAAFYGSMGGQSLNRPVVGMTVDPLGGYYEVAADGGVFAFGAPFHGSLGCLDLAQPVVAVVASARAFAVGSGTACRAASGPRPLAATGWWPATAGCSASAAPVSPGRWGAKGRAAWSGWPTPSFPPAPGAPAGHRPGPAADRAGHPPGDGRVGRRGHTDRPHLGGRRAPGDG